MPPVVQGRRAPGPADAARFGVDWVRLGLGLASISVLLSQDCPRLRGIFPLRNGRSGRSALGCRFGLPFPRRLPGFPLRVPAWAGCRFGRIRGRAARWDGLIQPQYHCTPARRRGQALFVRPPPFFSGQSGGRESRAGAGRKKRRRAAQEDERENFVRVGCRSRASCCRSALSQRSFPLQESPVQSGFLPLPPVCLLRPLPNGRIVGFHNGAGACMAHDSMPL